MHVKGKPCEKVLEEYINNHDNRKDGLYVYCNLRSGGRSVILMQAFSYLLSLNLPNTDSVAK